MTAKADRRPLAVRRAGWAKSLAGALARTPVTPNQISHTGLVAALVAGGCFWGSGETAGAVRWVLLIGAGMFIQLRLLCNLLDGMVAIEGGKAAPTGAFWNEVPDRVADILILAGAGYGIGEAALGWAAVATAVLTAYMRQVGMVLIGKADFRGPMAKQHRMALLTIAAIAACFAGPVALKLALWIVVVGGVVTAVLRGARVHEAMRLDS